MAFASPLSQTPEASRKPLQAIAFNHQGSPTVPEDGLKSTPHVRFTDSPEKARTPEPKTLDETVRSPVGTPASRVGKTPIPLRKWRAAKSTGNAWYVQINKSMPFMYSYIRISDATRA
jgi:hypothetical protein